MSAATIFFAVLFYAATAILVAGLAFKIADYARTPAPLKIPTTPAPTSTGGVVLRMLREVALFESLFKSNLWIWAFGILFHGALLLVLLRHLRYFTEPVWFWVGWVQPFGLYAGFAMVAGLARPVGPPLPRRAHPLHLDAVRPPDAGPAGRHRALRPGHEVPHAHRHRRREGLLPRPDALRHAAAARAPRPLHAPDAGGAADDRFPLQQAAACAGRVLQPDPQPGRQSAREAPPGAVGRRTRRKN